MAIEERMRQLLNAVDTEHKARPVAAPSGSQAGDGSLDPLDGRRRTRYEVRWEARTGTIGGRDTEDLETIIEDIRWALKSAHMGRVTISAKPPIGLISGEPK